MTWGFWEKDDDPGSDPTFIFDAIDSESIEVVVEPTEHAVEDGADINNHCVSKPRKINISGTVTPCVLGENPDYSPTRVSDAIGVLDKLASKRQPIVVVCSYWARDDMVISMINATYTHADGEKIKTNIELSQVGIVTPEVVDMPLVRLRSGKHRRRGSQSKNGGGDKKNAKKGATGNMIKGLDKSVTDDIASGIGESLLGE